MDLRKIGHGIEVIPIVFKDQVMKSFSNHSLDLIMETSFEPAEKELANVEESNPTIFWHGVQKLEQAAKKCFNNQVGEPTWNAQVHTVILILPLDDSQRPDVWFRDVTEDQIINSAYLPSSSTVERSSQKCNPR